MNYLRGALSAASQYYKDLPPINPSTLTGAIDVIVIERPAEDGGTELACSPFHVRFGKWQVLRPGEKKVEVLVNGHPIPFDMKIGDAGEAFFVFKTDEDVPDELITSPLLQPTNVGQSDDKIDEPVGRFGPKDGRGDKDEFAEQPQQSAEGELPQEPDFLDLNAPSVENGSKSVGGKVSFEVVVTSPLEAHADRTPSALSILKPPDVSIPKSDRSEFTQATHPAIDSSDLLDYPRRAAPIPIVAAPTAARRDGVSNQYQNGAELHEGVGDDMLPSVDEREARPPDVTYHHDVVLDLSGYHSRETSEQTVVASDDSLPRQSDSSLETVTTPDTSRDPSPEPIEDMPGLRIPRASSEPPEYGASASPPPEYSWEWGAFPQRSPLEHPFPAEDSDVPQRVSFPVSPPDRVDINRAPSPPRARSPIHEAALADGGRLVADTEDPYRIWLDFEGQKISFELSLCGDTLHGEDAIEDARYFDADRVTFTRLLEDSNVVHSRDLVIRWDDEYVHWRDNSSLMSALANWRRRSISPPTSPNAYASETQNGRSAPIATPRPSAVSTWSRWWSRNRKLTDVKETVSSEHGASQKQPQAKRPSLDHALSAPDAVSLVPPPATVPQSSVPFPSAVPLEGKRTKYAKTLRLTSDQLKALNLKKGANSITFSLSASGQVACTARIFVWDSEDHILVSDIDGTITKSDALGHVFTMIGRDWTHLGVAKLYTDICRNGYKIMYLTSRAIGQADSTRDYLKGINQNNYQLPEGPVIMSPDRLLTSLHREVIMRKPEVFKMACLRDIQRLFGSSSHNAFYAGFGNRITDALSYRSVNIPSARIFTIDSTGEVKMELLELAGYKSSYIHMTDIVDQMFPPVNRKWAAEYTDFNYWRNPVQEYELPEGLTMPPSPTLSASARSDTSNQSALSRLRNFSLSRPRGRGPTIASSGSSTPANRSTFEGNGYVRAVSSLDRLGNDFASGRYVHSDGKGKERDDGRRGVNGIRFNSEEFEYGGHDARSRWLKKRMSADNMPGSLPGSVEDKIWGMRDPRWLKDHDDEDCVPGEVEDGEDEDDDVEDEDAEEAAEEAFDDDLLATGEMENVPFL